MNALDLCINIFEGFILSGFMGYFFGVKNPWRYVPIVGFLIAIEITISNFINQYDWLLIFIIISTLFISLIRQNKDKYVVFLMCVFINIVLLCCNGISLYITSLVFELPMSELTKSLNVDMFYIAILISKILLIFSMLLLCSNKITASFTLGFRQWWMFSVVIFVLLLLSIIVLEVVMLQKFNFYTMVIALALIAVAIILIVVLLYRTIDENERLIRVSSEISRIENKEKSFRLISMINDETGMLLHNLKYFLLLVKNELNKGDYMKVSVLVDEKIEEVINQQTVAKTGNLVFDYNLNYFIRKHNLKKRNIKFMISLDKNDFLENQIFLDYINDVLQVIVLDEDDYYRSFSIETVNNHVIVKIIMDSITDLERYWKEKLPLLKTELLYKFDFKKYSDFCMISIIMSMD